MECISQLPSSRPSSLKLPQQTLTRSQESKKGDSNQQNVCNFFGLTLLRGKVISKVLLFNVGVHYFERFIEILSSFFQLTT